MGCHKIPHAPQDVKYFLSYAKYPLTKSRYTVILPQTFTTLTKDVSTMPVMFCRCESCGTERGVFDESMPCPQCGGKLRETSDEEMTTIKRDKKSGSNSDGSSPQSSTSPIEFPSHIMTGAAGRFADCYAGVLEPCKHFFFMSYLTCLGCAVADKLKTKSEIPAQPRLYTLLLGESADDRKSTAIDKTIDLFYDYIEVCDGVGSAEGLAKKLSKSPNTLLSYDELKSFVSKSAIKGSVLLPCLVSLFERNRYENVTQEHDIHITGAKLSFIAASTIDTYNSTWSTQFTDIGFNNRIFIVPGSGSVKSFDPPPVDEQHKREIMAELGAIIGSVGDGLEIDKTDSSFDMLQQWYEGRERSAYSKRLDGYARRLMVLLAINEGKFVIDDEIAKRTIDLVEWQLEMRKIYSPIDADGIVAQMEEKIRRQLMKDKNRDGVRERDLKNLVHYTRTGIENFERAMTNLKRTGEIMSHPTKRSRAWMLTDEVDNDE